MKRIIENQPIFSIKNFYSFKNKKQFVKDILKQREHFFKLRKDALQYNFLLAESKNTEILYNSFLKVAKKHFGKFNLLETNLPLCFSLCTNKDYYKSVPHNHLNTSTINSVYYLNVPNNEGKIQFLVNNKWLEYQPVEKELLIFPNYLEHNTTKNNTKEWRISINMEILCDYDWNKNERI